MALHNPWEDFLNQNKDIAFNAYRPTRGPQSFLDWARNSQRRVEQDYQARLGQMALAGQAPSLERSTFLQQYPFLERFMELSPSQRGMDDRRFAPMTRFLS